MIQVSYGKNNAFYLVCDTEESQLIMPKLGCYQMLISLLTILNIFEENTSSGSILWQGILILHDGSDGTS